jgi:hypothetical protein
MPRGWKRPTTTCPPTTPSTSSCACRTVCPPSASARASDTLFVRAALKAGTGGGSTGTEPRTVSPDDLAGEALESYSCIFLCNALPLPGQSIAALEQYVRAGGLLVIFPGARATLADYQPWTSLPGRPSAVIETAQTDRKRTLSWDRPAHPMLRPMRTGMGVPSLSILRHLAWEKLEPDAESVASLFAGQPFLLDRPFGSGRVLLFAVSADRAWSGFPLSPYFLPFVVQAVEYGALVGGHTPFLWGGDSIALDGLLPPESADAGLIDPAGRPVSIRTALVEGRTRRYAESVTEPGIYRIDGGDRPPAFAVNMSPARIRPHPRRRRRSAPPARPAQSPGGDRQGRVVAVGRRASHRPHLRRALALARPPAGHHRIHLRQRPHARHPARVRPRRCRGLRPRQAYVKQGLAPLRRSIDPARWRDTSRVVMATVDPAGGPARIGKNRIPLFFTTAKEAGIMASG